MCRLLGSLFLCGMVALLAGTGCDKASDKKAGGGQGGEALVLEHNEIDLRPGEEKQVQVKAGKADLAVVAKNLGLTAKVEGDHVVIAAASDAKDGTHTIKVTGGPKDVTLKVNIKK